MEFKIINKLVNVFNIIVLIGSLTIFTMLSIEMLTNTEPYKNNIFLNIQLWVCIIFLIDFILRWIIAKKKLRFFLHNFIFLFVSIPFLNIAYHMNIPIDNSSYFFIKLMPIIRGTYGIFIIVKWITASSITSIFFSYIIMITSFTFFASIVFYATEKGINPEVNTFWNALYWALMNVTTVGASVFAKGFIGQVLAVMLAGSGMMLFPIFTAYITSKVKDAQAKRNRA